MADRALYAASMEPPDNAALIARLRENDERALVTLAELYFDRLVAFVFPIVGSYDAAKDVSQDVFMRVWDLRATLDPALSIKAYLFRLAKNRALGDLKYRQVRERHQQRMQSDAGYDPSLASAPSREEEILSQATVDAALLELSERRQLAVRLRLEQQLTHAEIAQVLGIAAPAAERLVQRGLDDLRRVLRSRGVSGFDPR